MDPALISAELQATCSALGYAEDGKYYKEPECLEALKDLIRYLKHDDDNHKIRRELGEMKIMQTDLLPMLKSYWKDKELLDVILRLMVNLTNPALLLFNGIPPKNRDSRNIYLEIVSHLQSYKEVFVDNKIFAILSQILGQLLKLDWEHRQEEDRLVIERLLILVRNILHVPANPQRENRTDNDATIHDQILWAIHLSGMEDLLLYTSSSNEESNLCFHVLEIISLMFREQDPTQLASAGTTRSQTEKGKDNDALAALREKELAEKSARARKFEARWHSRFGGSYTVKNVKSISDRELICHAPISQALTMTFDRNKSVTRRPRNRQLAPDIDATRQSTLSIRLFLKEFCIEFLNSSYNPLMSTVKDHLLRDSGQDHDETYYIWAMKFFMEFNRNYKFRVELISETMSLSTFHFLQTEIDKDLEMIKVTKENIPIWSRRLHISVKAYSELLQTLSGMSLDSDPKIRESSRVLKGNMFYLTEYRELSLSLLQDYSEIIMPKSYLKDVVEMTHTFLNLLQNFTRESNHLIIQQKARKLSQKKKTKKPPPPTETSVGVQLDALWDSLSGEVSSVIQGHVPLGEDVLPFDAASETPLDEQRSSSMSRIQFALRNSQPPNAVALFRACRDVWPEDDAFGASDISPEDELLALREIFYAPLPGADRHENLASETGLEDVDLNDNEDEDENEDVEMRPSRRIEQEFDFKLFIKKFASPKVLRPYALLLRQYSTNSTKTNHCIVKMLHRISWDCNEFTLLFQASVFRTFTRILDEDGNGTHKELIKFSKFILTKFFEIARNNNKILVELLFWKNIPEAQELQYGYGTHQNTNNKLLWTEEQEDELSRLYRDHKDDDGDVVDYIVDHLIDDTRTRRQVIAQLKRQNLITDVKELTKKAGNIRKTAKTWSKEEEEELKDLFEQNRDNPNVVGAIEKLMVNGKSKKQLKEKIVQMGLVADKKELRKRRDTSEKRKVISIKKREKQTQKEPRTSASSGDDVLLFESNESNLQSSVDLLTSDLKSSLTWLVDNLREVAIDREQDDPEPVPLLPLSEETQVAIDDNPVFIEALKLLDLKPPNSEQESFWRIPVTLTSSMLLRRAEFLDNLLNRDVIGETSNTQNAVSSSPTSNGITNSKLHDDNSSSSSSEDSDDEFQESLTFNASEEMVDEADNRKSSLTKRKIDDSDDDDDDDEPIAKTHATKRVRRLVESDEEDS